MSKQQLLTSNAPPPGGAYSQGLRVGKFIFVAGQHPIHPVNGAEVGTTIEEQTVQTLENVQAVLQAGGASMADVVKATVHLSDVSLFDRFNAVYARYFPDPKPVRTTVGSQLLSSLIEIDVIAVVE